jgi:uncharacterized protein
MVGRQSEIEIMQHLLKTKQSEMLAMLGRRRVGKTYLIKQVYKKHIAFEFVGIKDEPLQVQLENFYRQFHKFFGKEGLQKQPKTWNQAFHALEDALEKTKAKQKRVLFFDEVPWMAEKTKKQFISALGYFWNNCAVNNNVLVVICGSAASWILENIINNNGGLHNRVTRTIQLKPFTLKETEAFLKYKKIRLNHYHTALVYMALGGIPFYLNLITEGQSAAQIVQKLCFSKNAPLQNEFENLYKALFRNASLHLDIVRILQKKLYGLTRQEIVAQLKYSDGGTFTKALNELIQCDFIIELPSYSKKTNHIVYRLIDEFTIFYLKFMQSKLSFGSNYWLKQAATNEYKVWCGLAFENLCFKHTQQIAAALKLQAIYTNFYSYRHNADNDYPGVQIDMVIDRADNIIDIIEIKFSNNAFIISKDYARKLGIKKAVFEQQTKTRKLVQLSFLTTLGLASNIHSNSIVANSIEITDLFQ